MSGQAATENATCQWCPPVNPSSMSIEDQRIFRLEDLPPQCKEPILEHIISFKIEPEKRRLMRVCQEISKNGILRVRDLVGKTREEIFQGLKVSEDRQEEFAKEVQRFGILI